MREAGLCVCLTLPSFLFFFFVWLCVLLLAAPPRDTSRDVNRHIGILRYAVGNAGVRVEVVRVTLGWNRASW